MSKKKVLEIADKLRCEFSMHEQQKLYAEMLMLKDFVENDQMIKASIISGRLEVLTANTNEYKMVIELQEAIINVEEPENPGLSIQDMDLSVRSFNCLKSAGVNTVKKLSNLTVEDVKRIPNLGQRSFEEISRKLNKCGYSFRESEEQN